MKAESLRHKESFVTCSSAAFDSVNEATSDRQQEKAPEPSPTSILGVPRRWRRAVLQTTQDTFARIPLLVPALVRKNTNDAQTRKVPQRHASLRTNVRASFQTSVNFVAAPLRSLRKQPVRQSGGESRPKTNPFRKSRSEAPSKHSLPLQPSLSELIATPLSPAVIVPVVEQTSWDIVAVLLSCCSSGLQAAFAVLLLLIPTNILIRWWRYFSDSWIVLWLEGYWLWFIHSLHAGKRQAREGRSQHTSKILAAGAALAIYNASMQPQPPPRRSKWRKKSV